MILPAKLIHEVPQNESFVPVRYYRLCVAVANAIFRWGGLLVSAYAASEDPALLFRLGKMLMDMINPHTPSKVPEDEAILTAKEVCELLKVTRSRLTKLRKDPDFPHGKLIGSRSRRWTRSEILTWVAKR